MQTFGQRLRALRNARGLRQIDLAHLTGTSRQQLNNYEGDRSMPAWPILLRLAQALEVPTDAFDTATYSAGEAARLTRRRPRRGGLVTADVAGRDA
jgi:putative transcriptional regulator